MNTRRGKATQREQELIAHVRRAEAGKVTLRQYCRANGLNVQSLYNLRSRLARKEAGRRPAPTPKKRKAASPFVAVHVATPAIAAATACRLHVKGWVIECSARLPPLPHHRTCGPHPAVRRVERKPSGKHVIAVEVQRTGCAVIRDEVFCRDYAARAAFSSGLTFQGSRASSSASVVARGNCSNRKVKYAWGLMPFARHVPTTL